MNNKSQCFLFWPLPIQLISVMILILLKSVTIFGQLPTSEMIDKYPILLYAEGKKPKLATHGSPFVFIEINEDNGIGYLGFHPYKGPLYTGCWFFKLIKVNDSLFTAMYYTNDGSDSNKIEFLSNTKIFKIIGYKYKLQLKMVTDYVSINRIRNIIYASAQYEKWRSQKNYASNFSYLPPCYQNQLFELPFETFVERIAHYNSDEEWVNLFCNFKIHTTINLNNKKE